MSDIEFDTSQLDKLSADIGRVSGTFGPDLRKTVEVSARNIKDDWRSKLEGATALPGAARAISYDLKGTYGIGVSEIEAEVGASQGGQGSLVFVTEFGAKQTAPRGYGARALADEAPAFEKALERTMMQALGEIF